MKSCINLDHYAGTPVLLEVEQAVAQAMAAGNPSSVHAAGRQAAQMIEQARKQVAALINAAPDEITFTSCGTESNNWALRGLYAANKRKGTHLVISAIEHPSVSLAARRLQVDSSVDLTVLPVDHEGFVSPANLKTAMMPQTALVSLMLANGEVGTIEPIKELAAVAHEHGALFHTDAVAACGNIPIDVKALGVDALTLAANQFGGPQGAAALFVREGVRILPLLEGGGQETGARSGTENVPAIVGMGVAAEIARNQLPEWMARAEALRNRLCDGLLQRIEGLHLNGPQRWCQTPRDRSVSDTLLKGVSDTVWGRLPHNLHLCIEGVASESLVLGLDQAGIAAGLGSACNSKSMRPSHVLKAMGLTDEQAKGALVLTVGVETTEAEINQALEIIPKVVKQLRSVTALTSR